MKAITKLLEDESLHRWSLWIGGGERERERRPFRMWSSGSGVHTCKISSSVMYLWNPNIQVSVIIEEKNLQLQGKRKRKHNLSWEHMDLILYRVCWSSVQSRGHKYFWIVACTGYLNRLKVKEEKRWKLVQRMCAIFILSLMKQSSNCLKFCGANHFFKKLKTKTLTWKTVHPLVKTWTFWFKSVLLS